MKFEIEITEDMIVRSILNGSYNLERVVRCVVEDEMEGAMQAAIRAGVKGIVDKVIAEEVGNLEKMKKTIADQFEMSIRTKVGIAVKKALNAEA